MEKIKSRLITGLIIILVLGFYIDTGGGPEDETLVYLNPAKTTYYAPTRTPSNSGFTPISYKAAKALGAKADKTDGFYINGPPLIISLLEYTGLFEWPRYWGESSARVERFK